MKVGAAEFSFFVPCNRAYMIRSGTGGLFSHAGFPLGFREASFRSAGGDRCIRRFSPRVDLHHGGRCGTPNCHCHKPDDPGHGPNYRLTYKVEGKTVTESFPNPAAQRKAEREVAGFRTYQELSRTLIDTNEKICRARPVEDTLTPQEKKRRKRSGRKSNGR